MPTAETSHTRYDTNNAAKGSSAEASWWSRWLPESFRVAIKKDPALHGFAAFETVLYPGIWALQTHRISHFLRRNGVPFLPRLLSQALRLITGIEIHPGAEIGKRFFIDHGEGVVIGETAEVGDDVMMYHNVTLGGHGWWTDAKGSKRHPTIGNNVTIGVGASILGPVTVGDNTRIGPHALIIEDIPANSVVVGTKGQTLMINGIRQDPDVAKQFVEPTWLQNHDMGGL